MACAAVASRMDVTTRLANAFDIPLQPLAEKDLLGTEKGLMVIFSVVHGIVREYLDGGDQMVELCSCGKHEKAPANWIDPEIVRYWLNDE